MEYIHSKLYICSRLKYLGARSGSLHASRNNVICCEEHIDNKLETQTGLYVNISYTQQGCHPLWFKSERKINLLFDCHKAVGLPFHKSLMCVHCNRGPPRGYILLICLGQQVKFWGSWQVNICWSCRWWSLERRSVISGENFSLILSYLCL